MGRGARELVLTHQGRGSYTHFMCVWRDFTGAGGDCGRARLKSPHFPRRCHYFLRLSFQTKSPHSFQVMS